MVLPTNWILSATAPSFRRFRIRALFRHEEQIRNMIGKNADLPLRHRPVEANAIPLLHGRSPVWSHLSQRRFWR